MNSTPYNPKQYLNNEEYKTKIIDMLDVEIKMYEHYKQAIRLQRKRKAIVRDIEAIKKQKY